MSWWYQPLTPSGAAGPQNLTLTATDSVTTSDSLVHTPGGGGGLATIAITSKVAYEDNTDLSAYSTGSWTPIEGRLYLVTVSSRHATAAVEPTIAGNSMTWTRIETSERSSNGTRVTVWHGLAGSGATAGALTATFSEAQGGAFIAIDEVTGADTGGTNGSNAVRQAVPGNGGSSVAPSVTLAALLNANSVAYGAMTSNNNASQTPGSGFTALANLFHGALGQSLLTEWRTNVTVVDTAITSAWALIGLELKAGSTGPQALTRTATDTVTPTYAARVLRDAPYHYWRLGEASGDAIDLGSGAINANPYGSPTRNVTGLIADSNGAVDFNGTDARFVAELGNFGGSAWSIEAWFRADSLVNVGMILFHYDSALSMRVQSDGLRVDYDDDTATSIPYVTPIEAGVVYHAVATHDGSIFRIYLNGRQVVTEVRGSDVIAPADWYIGAHRSTPMFFDGVIDEIAMYQTALSVEAVMAHYTLGSERVPRSFTTMRTAADTTSLTESPARVIGMPRTATDTLTTTESVIRTAARTLRLHSDGRAATQVNQDEFNRTVASGWGGDWTVIAAPGGSVNGTHAIADPIGDTPIWENASLLGDEYEMEWTVDLASGSQLTLFRMAGAAFISVEAFQLNGERRLFISEPAQSAQATVYLPLVDCTLVQRMKVRYHGTSVLAKWWTPSLEAEPDWQVGLTVTIAAQTAIRIGAEDLVGETYSINYLRVSNVALADSVARQFGTSRLVTDTVTTTDSLAHTHTPASNAVNRTATDTTALTDQIGRTVNAARGPPDTVATTESVVRQIGARRTPTDTTTTTDSVARSVTLTRTATDTTSVTDAVAAQKAIVRNVADTTSVTDSVARSGAFTRSATDTTSVTDVLNQGQVRRATDTVVTTDAVDRAGTFTRVAADSVSTTDSVTRSVAVYRSASDTVTTTDSVARALGASRLLGDTTTTTDSLARTAGLARTASDTTVLSESVSQTLGANRSPIDTTTLTDQVNRLLAAIRTTSDTIETSDSIQSTANVGDLVSLYAVLEKEQGASYGVDALLLRTYDYSAPVLEAVIQTEIGADLEIDAIVQAEQGATASLDAFLLAQRAGSIEAAAVILAPQAASFGISAFVQGAGVGAFDVEAILYKQQSGSYDLAAQIYAERTSTYGLDALLIETVFGNYSLSAILFAEGEGSASLNAVIRKEAQGSASADAMVLAERADVFGVFAIVQAEQSGSFGISAFVFAAGSAAFSADAVVQAEQAGSYATDAVFRAEQTGSILLSAHVLAGASDTFSLDAVLQRHTAASLGVDAIVLQGRTDGFSLNAFLSTLAVEAFSVEAIVSRTQPGSVGASAVVLATTETTISVAATLRTTTVESLALDAYIYGVGVGFFGLDAVIFGANQAVFGIDALISVVHPDHIADTLEATFIEAAITADHIGSSETSTGLSADISADFIGSHEESAPIGSS